MQKGSFEIGERQDWGSAKKSSPMKKLKIITEPLFYKNRGAGQVTKRKAVLQRAGLAALRDT